MFNKFSIFNFQFSIIIIALSAIMIACSSDDSDDSGDDPAVPAQRTVIAFFDGNNNLSSELREDIVEMENGSKSLSSTTNLIVFANIRGDSAYVAEVVNGKKKKVRMWPKNFISTNPDNMLSVMQWIVEKYPAYEYGIIFGGHGTGSMVNIDEKNDTIPTTLHPAYAYATLVDNLPNPGYRHQPSAAHEVHLLRLLSDAGHQRSMPTEEIYRLSHSPRLRNASQGSTLRKHCPNSLD